MQRKNDLNFLLLIFSMTFVLSISSTGCDKENAPKINDNKEQPIAWKDFVRRELERNSFEINKLWESQKNFSLTETEFETQCHNAIDQHVSKAVENALTTLREEMKHYIENASIVLMKSWPINKNIQFDEHFNLRNNFGFTATLPTDCSEALTEKQQGNGIYLLDAKKRLLRPFGAFCERFDGKVWTIIQRRQDGTVDFNRNWNDYRYGFGHLDGEYWLGLRRIHALTSKRKYKLWIAMEDYAGNKTTVRYSKFSIANENEDFKLNVSGFSGNNADALSFNNEQKFSTKDRDNDIWSYNCVNDNHFGGWWFKLCTYCNPNGPYIKEPKDASLYWIEHKSLAYIHMAIHPV